MGRDDATPLRRDPVFLALALAAIAQAAWIGRSLWVADLNLHYPFPGGDGYDWIANALALRGEPAPWVQWTMILATLARYSHALGMIVTPTLKRPHLLRFLGSLFTYLTGFALILALSLSL